MKTSSQQFVNIQTKYLLQENKQLKLQISQLKDLNKAYQNSINQLGKAHLPKQQIVSILTSLILMHSTAKRDSLLVQRIQQLQSHLMVIEKIAEQASQSQKKAYSLLAQQFKILKQQIFQRNQQLRKYQQQLGEVDYLSSLVTKYIQIMTPTQQALSFKNQQQNLLVAIYLQKESIDKLTQQKQKLIKINIFMKQQLQKLRQQAKSRSVRDQQITSNKQCSVASQNQSQEQIQKQRNSVSDTNIVFTRKDSWNENKLKTFSPQKNGNNSSNNCTMSFMKLQNQLIKQEDNSSDSDIQDMNMVLQCPELLVIFPDKIKAKHSSSGSQQRKKVPKLNMNKIRQLMGIKEKQLRNNNNLHIINPTSRILQLQKQLQQNKKQMANMLLKYRTMYSQYKSIKVRVEQLENRNQLLINSNDRLAKVNKLFVKDKQINKTLKNQLEDILCKNINNNISIDDIKNLISFTQKKSKLEEFLYNILLKKENSEIISRSKSL